MKWTRQHEEPDISLERNVSMLWRVPVEPSLSYWERGPVLCSAPSSRNHTKLERNAEPKTQHQLLHWKPKSKICLPLTNCTFLGDSVTKAKIIKSSLCFSMTVTHWMPDVRDQQNHVWHLKNSPELSPGFKIHLKIAEIFIFVLFQLAKVSLQRQKPHSKQELNFQLRHNATRRSEDKSEKHTLKYFSSSANNLSLDIL